MLKTTQNTFEERVIKSLKEKFLGTSQSIETCLFQILVEETARSYDEGAKINFVTTKEWFDKGFREGNNKGYTRGETAGIKTGHKEGFHEGRIRGESIGNFMGYVACEAEYRKRERICGRALTESEMMVFIEELYEIYLAGKRVGFNKGFLYGVK